MLLLYFGQIKDDDDNDDGDGGGDGGDRPVDRCLVTLSGPLLNNTGDLGELPGQRYQPDHQCQLLYGQESYYCGVSCYLFPPSSFVLLF